MTAWTPPPPGDRREQLPDGILRLLPPGAYLCDPCQTARSLHAIALGKADETAGLDLDRHQKRLHGQCQIVQPWTGLGCRCKCRREE
ncbi:hypothetical protein [Streptomyces sp. NPDC005732]|uniref:hypothetical protein n=1 Tax=Streptomyces sp. NPDC005732 TaxID=3157057 RepID=UPI0033F471F2